MIDPFSLATGVAGLVSLGLEVTKIVKEFAGDVKNAPGQATEMLNIITSIKKNLEALGGLLNSSAPGQFIQTSAIVVVLQDLESTLQTVKDILAKKVAKHSQKGAALRRLRWPFDKDEHEKKLQYFQNAASTIEFALTVDGCRMLSGAVADVSKILSNERDILQQIQDLADSLKTVSVKVGDTQTSLGNLDAIIQSIKQVQQDNARVIDDTAAAVARIEKRWEIHETRRTAKQEWKEWSEFLNWVSTLSFEEKHRSVSKSRVENTCQWIREDAKFDQWLSSPKNSTIWIHGLPGSGKSVLFGSIVDFLKGSRATPAASICYVYFEYSNKEQQGTEAIFSSLLRQLLEQCPSSSIPKDLEEHYKNSKKEESIKQLSMDQCVRYIQELNEHFGQNFLMFDALDECPSFTEEDESRSKLLNTLKKLEASFKILITARFAVSSGLFSDVASLEIQAHSDDIVKYLNCRIDGNPRFASVVREGLDDICTLEHDILEKIPEIAGGMFLLARLHFDKLVTQVTARKIRDTLLSLSSGPAKLNVAYAAALNRVRDQGATISRFAIQAICWVYYARRNLRVEELRHALAVEDGDRELERTGLPNISHVVEICGGLMAIDSDNGTVRLVHLTLREYLDDNASRIFSQGEADIARTCITYLSFDSFATGPCQQLEELDARLEEYALLAYAAKNWGHHAQHLNSNDLIEALHGESFLYSQEKISAVVQASCGASRSKISNLISYHYFPPSQSFFSTPLHLAARFDLEALFVHMIDKVDKVLVEATDGKARTAIAVAARYGSLRVFNLLLERRATADEQLRATVPQLYQLANWVLLECSARSGHLQILRAILASDKFSILPMDLASALHIAARKNRSEVIELLLDSGANIESKTSYMYITESPFYSALEFRCEDAAQTLLRRGADPHTENDEGRTALSVACEQGYFKIVQSLLARGVDPNLGKYRCTSRSHSFQRCKGTPGDSHTCKCPRDGLTPLGAAASSLRVDIVKLLLENGADPNSGFGPLPLLLLPYSRSYVYPAQGRSPTRPLDEIIRLLLKHKADPIALALGPFPDSAITTALHIAAHSGDSAAVSAMMAAGASVLVPNDRGDLPIHAACQGRHRDTVKLLLSSNPAKQINHLDEFGRPPLFYYAFKTDERRRSATSRLLLEGAAGTKPTRDSDTSPYYRYNRRFYQDCTDPSSIYRPLRRRSSGL